MYKHRKPKKAQNLYLRSHKKLLYILNDTIKAKDTKRIAEFFSRRFGVFMTPLSSEIIIQVDNLQNQSELT